jgi:hypothetical protein
MRIRELEKKQSYLDYQVSIVSDLASPTQDGL